MVSFQCDGCADTVKKPKLDQHRQRCWASFTCLDCSKTFQNQDYKSHTSCISEAEKYQGALYKGPKKGKNGAPTPVASTSAPPPPVEAPAPVPGPSVVPAAAAIHPSRLSQLAAPPTPDFPARGGGFERGRGRGRGFGRGGGGGYGGGSVRMAATGENSFTNPAGMRSWGSTPTIEESQPEASTSTLTIPIPITVLGEAEAERPKKKKKKGDKGGTGSKANSKRPRGESENASVAPAQSETENKKRKRSASPAPAAAQTNGDAEPSDKQLKKLRKNLGKLETKASSMQLDQFLKQVGEGKKDSIASTDVLKSLKVGFSEGKWVLTV